MRHIAAALLLSLAATIPLRGQEIGFVEQFAWAEDRGEALKQLIPGTEEFYYYHCLQFQNTQRYDEAERMLEAWVARHKNTPRAKMMRNRQMLLTYGAAPQATLDYLRRTLKVRLDHQRERIGEKPNLPNALDPARISRQTLTAEALKRPNLDGFEDAALHWLAGAELDAQRRRILLSRVERPDLPGLVELIVADLAEQDSGGFGSLPIHARLTLDQLQQLLQRRPDLRNHGPLVAAYLAKLRPGADDDWKHNQDVQLAYLERLAEFVDTLGPVHNSLKAHVLHHRLDFDRSQGVYDKRRFLAYLRLPRNVGYVSPKLLELDENRRHRADLSQQFESTLLPPVGDDQPLVSSIFQHFFVDEETFEPYLPLVRSEYLKRVFAETKAVNGLGDPEQWASLLTPTEYRALKDRVDLDFDPQNRRLFRLNEPVSLDLHVKNVQQLIVKVFHINTANHARQTLREVNTDIQLDGLVPNGQRKVDYGDPPLRRVRRHFEFPELSEPGVYVIDFIGSGRSSRAVIRKGSVSHVVRATPSGQAVVVLNEDGQVARDAVIYFAGSEHAADEQGVVLLPFTVGGAAAQPMVVHHAGQAYVRTLVIAREGYSLAAGMHVERESLRSRGEAALLIRPQLYLDDSPVALSVLEDAALTIVSTDIDGVQSRVHAKDLDLQHDAETAHLFDVPPRLSQIQFKLEGYVKLASQGGARIRLTDSVSYKLNEIDKTADVADVHLAWSGGQYHVSLLGRTGEPLADRAVHVALKHRDFRQPVHVALQTDQRGRVRLGALPDIQWVAAQERADGHRRQWPLAEDDASLPGGLHGVAGETLELPWAGGEVTRQRLSLIEIRGGQFVADRFPHLKAGDGMLRLEKLPAGDYSLLVKGRGAVAVRVAKGPTAAGHVQSDVRQLQLKPAGATLASVAADDEQLTIRVHNADDFTRVHVLASHLVPAFSAFASLGRGGDAEPTSAALAARRSLFIEGRDIGDEYDYILRRQQSAKYPGNMLERPGLLLNPWSLRSTETDDDDAAPGASYSAVPDAPAETATPPQSQIETYGGEGEGEYASLSWLHAGAVIANLTPDQDGLIRVPRDELGGGQHVRVLLVHPRAVVRRSISLPEGGAKRADLRLADGLDPQGHFLQQQRVTVVDRGETFTLASVDSSRFERYDSLRRVFTLYETLSKDPKLAEFRFLLQWPQLSDEEKREKYSEFACHELNFYLLHKDRKFFQAVVQPYLSSKRDKTFLDQWLLRKQMKTHLDPWRYQRLNVVERVLIGQLLAPEQAAAARHVDELVELLPPDPQRDELLFNTAVQQSALALPTEVKDRLLAEREISLGLLKSRRQAAPEPSDDNDSPQMAPAAADPFGAPPTGETDSDKKRKRASLAGERFRNGKNAVVDESSIPFDDRGVMPGRAGPGRGTTGGGALGYFTHPYSGTPAGPPAPPLYRVLDKTKEWAENNYYHLPVERQNAERVTANRFWQDYARRGEGPFLSPHLAEASRNFTECLLALAVLDLPLESPEHETSFEGDAMKIEPAGPIVMFHEEIRRSDASSDETAILVSQNLFRNDDRHRYEGNQRLDKYVADEFLTHVAYGCQVVVTNPASSPQKLDLLLQIPEGSLPLAGARATRSVRLQLEPFKTQTVEFLFYFPAVGRYPMFPVHVSRNETLLASAEPRVLRVVESLSRVDRESWAYVSQNGTEAEVLEFLGRANLQRLPLDKIAFRMGDPQFFETVTGLLVRRHVYSHTLWSYSLRHDAAPRIRQFLPHEDQFVASCGPYLDSPLLTIDPVLRRSYQHLDYRPLVNARAHRLGGRRRILNDRLHQQYHALLAIHSCRAALDDDDRMSATCYLLLQDRVEEAIEMLRQVDANRLQTRLQHDYFTAYVSFYREDLETARRLADKHAGHPVDRWREAFLAVRAQLDEIEGASPDVIDQQSRDQRQTQLADQSPSFDFAVEGGQVTLDYQNLREASVNYYLMDIELLFSRNPFVQQFSGQFSHILPNRTRRLKFDRDRDKVTFALPEQLDNQNVLVEITAGGVTKTQAWYSNSLTVQLVERFGQVRVGDQQGRPLPKAYVKTFARLNDGSVKFFKDGYTDLRGRFDYSSLSTSELDNVKKFALLIMSDEQGAVVKEAAPPAR